MERTILVVVQSIHSTLFKGRKSHLCLSKITKNSPQLSLRYRTIGVKYAMA
jgi:hypothetical protein